MIALFVSEGSHRFCEGLRRMEEGIPGGHAFLALTRAFKGVLNVFIAQLLTPE